MITLARIARIAEERRTFLFFYLPGRPETPIPSLRAGPGAKALRHWLAGGRDDDSTEASAAAGRQSTGRKNRTPWRAARSSREVLAPDECTVPPDFGSVGIKEALAFRREAGISLERLAELLNAHNRRTLDGKMWTTDDLAQIERSDEVGEQTREANRRKRRARAAAVASAAAVTPELAVADT